MASWEACLVRGTQGCRQGDGWATVWRRPGWVGWGATDPGYVNSTIPAVSLLTEGGVVVALDDDDLGGRDIEAALP